jgi:probable rRNA maturation factor
MQIHFSDQQSNHSFDSQRCISAAQMIVEEAGYKSAEISIAIIDDETIHELNRRHLGHDYPTDVLSFVFEDNTDHLFGEVIVSADTAARNAHDYGWTTNDEVLLCVIHGVLHLVGYDDTNPEARAEMQDREQLFLSRFGLTRLASEVELGDESASEHSDATAGDSAS